VEGVVCADRLARVDGAEAVLRAALCEGDIPLGESVRTAVAALGFPVGQPDDFEAGLVRTIAAIRLGLLAGRLEAMGVVVAVVCLGHGCALCVVDSRKDFPKTAWKPEASVRASARHGVLL
jgi:hypothetical protein